MNMHENNGKIPFGKVSKELTGYRLRLELIPLDSESKPFLDLDHLSIANYFTQCFPGFQTSFGAGWENIFGPDDELDEDFDEE